MFALSQILAGNTIFFRIGGLGVLTPLALFALSSHLLKLFLSTSIPCIFRLVGTAKAGNILNCWSAFFGWRPSDIFDMKNISTHRRSRTTAKVVIWKMKNV